MITLNAITGIILSIIAIIKVITGKSEPVKTVSNENDFDLMEYNTVTGNYTVSK